MDKGQPMVLEYPIIFVTGFDITSREKRNFNISEY